MADLSNDEVISRLVDLGRITGDPKGLEAPTIPYTVIPNDCKVESLARFVHNEFAPNPQRKKGIAKVLDAASFTRYYDLFSDPDSLVFADETTSRILAVLDYHIAGDGLPRWGEHRADLTLRHSEEWKRWKANDGKRLGQLDFAEFIEDNAPDIVNPTAATMMEVARDLRAKTDMDFGSAVRLSNGSVQFKYTEQVKGSFGAGNAEVPEQFTIAIPIYIGSDRVSITARLRYRINSGKLTFWYDLLRADQAERDAFRATRESIAEALSITIINGQPA